MNNNETETDIMEWGEELNMVDMKRFAEELSKMQEENRLLQTLKEKYVVIASELKTMSESLLKMSESVDPASVIKDKAGRKPMKPIVQELYEKMTNGLHVTKEFLEKTYPDEGDLRYYQIIQTLKGMPNVQKAKDGGKVRLYI